MRALTVAQRKQLDRYLKVADAHDRYRVRDQSLTAAVRLIDAIISSMPGEPGDDDAAVLAELLRRKAAGLDGRRGLPSLTRLFGAMRARSLAHLLDGLEP